MRAAFAVLAAAAALILFAACGAEGSAEATFAAAGEPPAGIVTAAMLEQGRATYVGNCAPCHGTGGRGDGPSAANLDPKPRDHTDAAYMSTLSDKQIADTVRFGGAISGKPQMPSSPHLQGPELDALIAYVRSLSATPGERVAAR